MPQASDELRAKMAEYFGGDGINDHPPMKFLLEDKGWRCRAGMLLKPKKRDISQKEWDCVAFLCDEWDHGYDPALS